MKIEPGKTPKWLLRLIDKIGTCITPIDPMGEISWCWRPPVKKGAPWELNVYPTPTECYGGADDGKIFVPSFSLCLTEANKIFDDPPHIHWVSRTSRGKNIFHGPCCQLEGMYLNRTLSVSVMTFPPRNEKPGATLNCLTGEVKTKTTEEPQG